jgi:hypothetical protein
MRIATRFHQAPPDSDGAFVIGPVRRISRQHWLAEQQPSGFGGGPKCPLLLTKLNPGTLCPAGSKIADARPGDGCSPIAGLVSRAQEPFDWPGIAAPAELSKVRWGTLRLAFTRQGAVAEMDGKRAGDRTAIIAVFDGSIVGSADIWQEKGAAAIRAASARR